ncbi:MAG TPA: ABC transporter ATP-binding protein, partial [Thermotogales bacterium]|nr:ABC transporter ATP-binding protein [Thermotogales bacterium]
EPLSNLDAKVREYTRAELKRLHMDINITTIYVTHDQIEAMSLADRIVVMKLGEIQQVGKPREVYENPNNLFVANFIGSPGMNFFRVVKDGNYLILEDYRINVNELKKYRRILSGMNDGEMILGIRPEYIKLSNSRNGWQVKIDLVEPLGFEKIVDFLGKRTSGKLRTLKRVNLKPGDEVRILFDIEKIRLFDPKTGWNLLRMDQVDEVKVS